MQGTCSGKKPCEAGVPFAASEQEAAGGKGTDRGGSVPRKQSNIGDGPVHGGAHAFCCGALNPRDPVPDGPRYRNLPGQWAGTMGTRMPRNRRPKTKSWTPTAVSRTPKTISETTSVVGLIRLATLSILLKIRKSSRPTTRTRPSTSAESASESAHSEAMIRTVMPTGLNRYGTASG